MRAGSRACRSGRSTWMVRIYDRGLGWVLDHQGADPGGHDRDRRADVRAGDRDPEGPLPAAGHRAAAGRSPRRRPTSRSARMIERQRAVADVVRADPDVATVSSFIGADGTNPTLNNGRLAIALKPRDKRARDAQQIIDRIGARLRDVGGITRLPAGCPGPANREPRQPDAVPVHDRGRRPDGAGGLGAAHRSTACASCPSWPTSPAISRRAHAS